MCPALAALPFYPSNVTVVSGHPLYAGASVVSSFANFSAPTGITPGLDVISFVPSGQSCSSGSSVQVPSLIFDTQSSMWTSSGSFGAAGTYVLCFDSESLDPAVDAAKEITSDEVGDVIATASNGATAKDTDVKRC